MERKELSFLTKTQRFEEIGKLAHKEFMRGIQQKEIGKFPGAQKYDTSKQPFKNRKLHHGFQQERRTSNDPIREKSKDPGPGSYDVILEHDYIDFNVNKSPNKLNSIANRKDLSNRMNTPGLSRQNFNMMDTNAFISNTSSIYHNSYLNNNNNQDIQNTYDQQNSTYMKNIDENS